VVLTGKVYALLCKEAPDPSFVVIFEGGTSKRVAEQPPTSQASRSLSCPFACFLDKIKRIPHSEGECARNLPEHGCRRAKLSFRFREVGHFAERVIRDDALDSVGFEALLANKSDKDFIYDPESFAVRVGEEVYQQSVSDAGGLVPAGKSQTAFLLSPAVAMAAATISQSQTNSRSCCARSEKKWTLSEKFRRNGKSHLITCRSPAPTLRSRTATK